VKTAAEIRDRIRFLLCRELDRRVDEASQRLPWRCKFNHAHQLDARKQDHGERNWDYNRITSKRAQTMGLCMYGAEDAEQWPGDICEDEIDAKRCPWFEPIQTKEELLTEFVGQLQTEGWVEDNLPDVAQLLWALEAGGGTEVGLLVIPWWKRVWYWFLRIRVEPVVQVESPLALLEAVVVDPEEGEDAGDGS